jgi:hypothetical protein
MGSDPHEGPNISAFIFILFSLLPSSFFSLLLFSFVFLVGDSKVHSQQFYLQIILWFFSCKLWLWHWYQSLVYLPGGTKDKLWPRRQESVWYIESKIWWVMILASFI